MHHTSVIFSPTAAYTSIALHCFALHCLLCFVLHSFALICIALHCIASLCTACFALLCFASLYIALICIASFALICIALHCFAWHCFALLSFALLWGTPCPRVPGSPSPESRACSSKINQRRRGLLQGTRGSGEYRPTLQQFSCKKKLGSLRQSLIGESVHIIFNVGRL